MNSDAEQLNEIKIEMPAGIGGARPVELPATKYRQGGRTQYHIAISVSAVTRLIVTRPDPNRPLEGNRKVDASRAKKFGQYMLQNSNWVAPGIIVRMPLGEVSFLPKYQFDDNTSWGILQIPLDMLTEILLLDGQHRTLGIFMALDDINKKIQAQRQLISNLRDQEQPTNVIYEQEERLKHIMRQRSKLNEEHISIDLVEVAPDKAKLMFADINNNAKGVNADLTTVLNQRDIVNRIALQLIESHALLQDRVELGQSSRMSPTNPNLIGAKGVADIVRAVIVGTGRVGARIEDEIMSNLEVYRKRVEQFLDILVAAFDEFGLLIDGRLDPQELRGQTMLGSMTMLRVLAATYHELTRTGSDSSMRVYSRSEVEDFFRHLAPLLRRIPISTDDRLWLGTKVFTPGATAPLARQGSISSLVSNFVSWARDGIPNYSVTSAKIDRVPTDS